MELLISRRYKSLLIRVKYPLQLMYYIMIRQNQQHKVVFQNMDHYNLVEIKVDAYTNRKLLWLM